MFLFQREKGKNFVLGGTHEFRVRVNWFNVSSAIY